MDQQNSMRWAETLQREKNAKLKSDLSELQLEKHDQSEQFRLKQHLDKVQSENSRLVFENKNMLRKKEELGCCGTRGMVCCGSILREVWIFSFLGASSPAGQGRPARPACWGAHLYGR